MRNSSKEPFCMESPWELQNWRPFANPVPTLCQPFANPSPTFHQPFANLFCQPLSNPLFPWTLGTRLDTETRVNGFLASSFPSIFGPQNPSRFW